MWSHKMDSIFGNMARKNWGKYLPSMTRELKFEEIFEEEKKRTAEQAREELT